MGDGQIEEIDDEIDGDGDGPIDRTPEEDRVSPLREWAGNLPLLIILVLAVLVAGGAFVLWNRNQDLTSERDDRRDASTVASEFTTAVLSYDHQDLQGSVENVLALSTTQYGRQYEQAWFAEQQPIVEATQAVAEVAVDDVLLGDESNGVLPAVVTFNGTITSEVGVRRLTGSYLRLDLTKVDGQWRVDQMQILAITDNNLQPNTEGDGPAGTTPTTTAVP